MSKDDIELKLSAARTKLILDKPFLGALVLRMPLVEADSSWCRTTATDAKNLYYNPKYIEQLSSSQTQFMLAHEALHCALSHFARKGHREKHRWDVACDYAINPILIDEGLDAPSGSLHLDHFKSMTAEEIYPSIESKCDEEPLDDHVYDNNDSDAQADSSNGGGFGDKKESSGTPQQQSQSFGKGGQAGAKKPPPLSSQEKAELDVQWQQRLAGAAQQAMQAGKLSGHMARLVDHFLQPQLPWRQVLARYLSQTAKDDYSYVRPNTRRGGPAIYPAMRSEEVNVLVALDTSGSISEDEMQSFVSEVDALKGQMRARVTLLACDAELCEHGAWVYEPWESFELPEEIHGGGATDFRPVFSWTERQDILPDLLIYFTDAQGVFPEREPSYPVLWLVKGKGKVPFGQRVQLN